MAAIKNGPGPPIVIKLEKEEEKKQFNHHIQFPIQFKSECEKPYCSYEEYEKTGIWCHACLNPWTFSDYHTRVLDHFLGWTSGTLKLITCYGCCGDKGCRLSIENKWEIHCIHCSGDPDKIAQSGVKYDQPEVFDATRDGPYKIWACNGHKCHQETCYSETGIWCTSCHGLFAHSKSFLRLLEKRFHDGDTADTVLDDIDLSDDRI